MANIPVSPPQKKSANQAVMEAKENLKKLLKTNNIDPNLLIQLGNMAEQSVQNKQLYPMVVQEAIKAKLIDQKQVQKTIDYKLIGTLIGAGKLAKMIKENK